MRPDHKKGNAVKVLKEFAKLEFFLFDAVPEKSKFCM
jgi:hypothetical protein